MSLKRKQKEYKLFLLREKARRKRMRKFHDMFPDDGALCRGGYVKHIAFFAAGSEYKERLFMSANRVGKTVAGAYEVACHLTGDYPEWWTGKRFERPVDAWAAGDTNQTTRDIIQLELLGKYDSIGTGMIPGDKIIKTTSKTGVPEGIESVTVKNCSGGSSRLAFKSYDQGRRSFQGTSKDFIWMDEEPPLAVYVESLLRTMSTDGLMLLTFTPLLGLSDVVMQFLPGGKIHELAEGTKFVVMATWDDAPHLTEQQKQELWESIPPFQRDARAKGVPQLGSGAIYPIAEDDITIEPFEIPEWWPRIYGMDVGWNRTAVVWGAHDRERDTVYLYDEYYRGQEEPAVHTAAINARGNWINGVIDPAARGRGQSDGKRLIDLYADNLMIHAADNAVESGIHRIYTRLSVGKLKVFTTLRNWLGEYRIYRRDGQGRVVKENDHAMDATRYLCASGLQIADVRPPDYDDFVSHGHNYDGRSSIGGY